jgi:hypothetical protein
VPTIVPQQQLFFLNNPLVITTAERIVHQIRPSVSADEPHAMVAALYRRILGRDPSVEERSLAVRYVEGEMQAEDVKGEDDSGGWTRLAHLLLQSNERMSLE